jgi:hypothetical protein
MFLQGFLLVLKVGRCSVNFEEEQVHLTKLNGGFVYCSGYSNSSGGFWGWGMSDFRV